MGPRTRAYAFSLLSMTAVLAGQSALAKIDDHLEIRACAEIRHGGALVTGAPVEIDIEIKTAKHPYAATVFGTSGDTGLMCFTVHIPHEAIFYGKDGDLVLRAKVSRFKEELTGSLAGLEFYPTHFLAVASFDLPAKVQPPRRDEALLLAARKELSLGEPLHPFKGCGCTNEDEDVADRGADAVGPLDDRPVHPHGSAGF